jgi:hypothetical protein
VKRLLAGLLVVSMASFGQVQAAGLITTGEVAATESNRDAAADRALVLQTLQRPEVQARLQNLGVDPQAARARVAALTDAEVAALAEKIDTAPAGGNDVLVVALIAFLVLLMTDILGYTNIFPFVKHGSGRTR